MAGYDLKEGQFEKRNASDDELWSAISNVFSAKIKTNSSYKYGMFKAILDNLYNVDEQLILSFDKVFSKFAEIYWNLILKHHLKQQIQAEGKGGTYLEQIIWSAVKKYELPLDIPYESLPPEIMIDINHQVKMKCKMYVVGALFEDTRKLFYSFSKKGEWIQINPVMYEFLCKHKVIVEKLNYYQWAKFLEKVNAGDSTNLLLSKIDESAKRNNLTYYRQILFEEFENKCFYCGVNVNSKVDVDHFIPWSFVKDDSLWNLVLSCPACNRSKSDKLAAPKYLDILIDRNRKIHIERIDSSTNYEDSKLREIYYWAKVNGYDEEWRPRK